MNPEPGTGGAADREGFGEGGWSVVTPGARAREAEEVLEL